MLEQVTFERLNFLFCLDGILFGLLVDIGSHLHKSIGFIWSTYSLYFQTSTRDSTKISLPRIHLHAGNSCGAGDRSGWLYIVFDKSNVVNPRVHPRTICPYLPMHCSGGKRPIKAQRTPGPARVHGLTDTRKLNNTILFLQMQPLSLSIRAHVTHVL